MTQRRSRVEEDERSDVEAVLIVMAGFSAGVVNVVAGAGTLITFPALLAMGVPPVTANVSSSVGLIPGSLSGVWGFRRELRAHWRPTLRLALCSGIGAALGGWLLVVLPPTYFGVVVPYLLLVAAVLAAGQPLIGAWVRSGGAGNARPTLLRRAVLPVAALLTGVYGGYFGAAQGVILLAVLGILWAGTLVEANGVKNALVAVANGISAIVFVAVGAVDWRIAGLVGLGALLGGLVGARVSRWLPAVALRAVLVVVAVVAAVVLFVTG